MHGRIRTIKPEAHTDEELWDLEQSSGLPLFRTFVGLWNYADREGRFEWRPRALKAAILPYWPGRFEDALDALWRGEFIQKYRVDGRDYGLVCTFTQHQVINNREGGSTLPEPSDDAWIPPDDSPTTRGSRVEHASGTRGDGPSEQRGPSGDQPDRPAAVSEDMSDTSTRDARDAHATSTRQPRVDDACPTPAQGNGTERNGTELNGRACAPAPAHARELRDEGDRRSATVLPLRKPDRAPSDFQDAQRILERLLDEQWKSIRGMGMGSGGTGHVREAATWIWEAARAEPDRWLDIAKALVDRWGRDPWLLENASKLRQPPARNFAEHVRTLYEAEIQAEEDERPTYQVPTQNERDAYYGRWLEKHYEEHRVRIGRELKDHDRCEAEAHARASWPAEKARWLAEHRADFEREHGRRNAS